MEEAEKLDEALNNEYERWKSSRNFGGKKEAEIQTLYRQDHDLGLGMFTTTAYSIDHKVIHRLAKPGMLDRLRQARLLEEACLLPHFPLCLCQRGEILRQGP